MKKGKAILTPLSNFQIMNIAELSYIVGGNTFFRSSECWEDSTSRDSYKKDTGGCSKKRDKPAAIL